MTATTRLNGRRACPTRTGGSGCTADPTWARRRCWPPRRTRRIWSASFPYVTAAEYYEGWTYEGGALMQWFASSWTSGLALDTLRRKTAALTRSKEWVEQLPVEDYRLLQPAHGRRRRALFPRLGRARDQRRILARDQSLGSLRQDEYQSAARRAAGTTSSAAARFAISSTCRKQAPTAEARNGQRLLMGPWAHAATSPEGKIGDVTFGKQAVLDMNATILKWYDYVMKGRQNEFATGAPVRIFVMGDNVWRDEQEFPLLAHASTRSTTCTPARARIRRAAMA